MTSEPTSHLDECIEHCQECHRTCLETFFEHCLNAGGKHLESVHVRLLMDCAQICQVSADFMLRGSAHHTHICRECAEICSACAESCEAVGGMEECVQACRDCAESCRAMGEMR